jgi:hypothetical protein
MSVHILLRSLYHIVAQLGSFPLDLRIENAGNAFEKRENQTADEKNRHQPAMASDLTDHLGMVKMLLTSMSNSLLYQDPPETLLGFSIDSCRMLSDLTSLASIS